MYYYVVIRTIHLANGGTVQSGIVQCTQPRSGDLIVAAHCSPARILVWFNDLISEHIGVVLDHADDYLLVP